MWFDKFSCKRSDLVITVGRDLIDTLNGRFKGKKPKSALINNWIDEKEIYPLESEHPRVKEFKKKYGLDGKFVIMYSGNIGLYYDCLLYTSDAADDLLCVDLGGPRLIKKKKHKAHETGIKLPYN